MLRSIHGLVASALSIFPENAAGFASLRYVYTGTQENGNIGVCLHIGQANFCVPSNTVRIGLPPVLVSEVQICPHILVNDLNQKMICVKH